MSSRDLTDELVDGERVGRFVVVRDDGWFAIIDALLETILSNAEKEGRSPEAVGEVKGKLGTLRLDYRKSKADEGANVMSEEMSCRLCEVTGRRGATAGTGGDGRPHGLPGWMERRYWFGTLPVIRRR